MSLCGYKFAGSTLLSISPWPFLSYKLTISAIVSQNTFCQPGKGFPIIVSDFLDSIPPPLHVQYSWPWWFFYLKMSWIAVPPACVIIRRNNLRKLTKFAEEKNVTHKNNHGYTSTLCRVQYCNNHGYTSTLCRVQYCNLIEATLKVNTIIFLLRFSFLSMLKQ